MNPFENINIPNEENSTPISCGSDLTVSINQYFEEQWRYLNKTDTIWILDTLSLDIDSCHTHTKESLAAVNSEMYENWINVVNGWIWEERFLAELWIDKNILIADVTNFPEQYTLRVSGEWVIFSDMEWRPLVNYNRADWEYSSASWNTMTDNMSDNVDGGEYVLNEAFLQNSETDEANNALDAVLKEWSIQIDELEDPENQEYIARLYGLNTSVFRESLNYFLKKSGLSLFEENPDMKMLTSWNFQISVKNDSGHHIVNFTPNWDVESEYTF